MKILKMEKSKLVFAIIYFSPQSQVTIISLHIMQRSEKLLRFFTSAHVDHDLKDKPRIHSFKVTNMDLIKSHYYLVYKKPVLFRISEKFIKIISLCQKRIFVHEII